MPHRSFLLRGGRNDVAGLPVVCRDEWLDVVGRRNVVLPDHEAKLPRHTGHDLAWSGVQAHHRPTAGDDRRGACQKR
jgi:hypothetical protein